MSRRALADRFCVSVAANCAGPDTEGVGPSFNADLRRPGSPLSRAATPPRFLFGDGACDDGLDDVSGVGDLDLAGLGLLGDGDGQGEHTVLVAGAEVVTVEALAEEQLAAELTLGSFGDLDLIALGSGPSRASPSR